jgi:hypothetical protein
VRMWSTHCSQVNRFVPYRDAGLWKRDVRKR